MSAMRPISHNQRNMRWTYPVVLVIGIVIGVFLCRFFHKDCPECPQIKQESPKAIFPTEEKTNFSTKDSSYTPVVKTITKKHYKPVLKEPVLHTNQDITFVVPEGYSLCDELMKNHYSTRFYDDNVIDSAMTINIKDSVSENKIIWRSVHYLAQPISVQSRPRNKLFIGAQVSGTINSLYDFGPTAMFLSKRDIALQLHWNALEDAKNISVTGLWKIRVRR